MANNLLDALKRTLETKQQVQPTGSTGLQNVLATAKTGQVQNAGPQVTGVPEIAANQQTQLQLDLQGQQNQVQSQATQADANRQSTINQQTNLDLSQRRDQLSQALAQKETELLGEIERDRTGLESESNRNRMEQLGATIALQNQQYLQALENVNRYRRLDDEANFKIALMESQYANMESMFRDRIQFEKLMNADDRTFREMLAHMDINAALAVADLAAQGSVVSGIIQGGVGVGEGVLKYANTKGQTK